MSSGRARAGSASPGRSIDDRLVGRRQEQAEIERFLDRCRWGLHGMLLSGPAGIGKSTLWHATLERARALGLRVLTCRPTQVETQLSFSALIDLFADVAEDVLPALPEPQRMAVDVALMRSSADQTPAPLAISVGVMGMIRAAADQGPVLLALDDAPWLDDSSALVLEFALRRLEDARVGVLATQRTEGARPGLPGIVAAIAPERRSTLALSPVPVDDIADIVRRTLGITLRRPVLLRVHELSGGNAFYALELARALERRGHVDGGDLPIPDSLDELLRDRTASLPESGAEVALLAAALSVPTRDVLAATVGEAAADDGIAAGVAAGVLVAEGGAVRFDHPLLAAAIYDRARREDRRAAHRSLAGVVHDPEERARHLALSAEAPDDGISAALEEAASAARSRGAGVAAAELAEAAVRLTPADDAGSIRRRTMAAADYHLAAGDLPRAVTTLERLAAETAGSDRGPVLVALGEVLMNTSDRPAAGRAFRQALPLVGDDLALRARIELGLAGIAFLTWVDWRSGDRHVKSALRAAESLGDRALLLQTIGHVASWDFLMGRGVPRQLMARAASLEDARDLVPVLQHPDLQFADSLTTVGALAEARPMLEGLLTEARRRGEWYSLPWIMMRIARLELMAGRWRVVEQQLDEGTAAAQQSGQDAAVVYLAQIEVSLLALRGEVERCRTAAAHVLQVSEQMGLAHRMRTVITARALLSLSLGDAGEALADLEPLLDLDAPGQSEPGLLRPAVPLAIEALIGLGRLPDAEALLEPYERLARRRRRDVSLADASHCRAILLAARGEMEPAIEAAAEGLRRFEALAMPFEGARASLALGEIRRRARQKAAAREAVGRAVAAFEALGAERWADRARAELGRTEPRRTPGAELTETEQRVVDLLAEGRTNREIASALFMSVHTVEAHLTRIYRSLGVRSRTELARRMLDRGTR